jgi:hypothetical protein
VAVKNALVSGTLDPFLQASAVHALEPHEAVAAEADAPVYGGTNVRPHGGPVNANDGVPFSRQIETAECSPQELARGHELSRHVRARHDQGVSEQDRGSPTGGAAEEEVESDAVG